MKGNEARAGASKKKPGFFLKMPVLRHTCMVSSDHFKRPEYLFPYQTKSFIDTNLIFLHAITVMEAFGATNLFRCRTHASAPTACDPDQIIHLLSKVL